MIDDDTKFVTQHYHDFLNREPDAAGLAFWKSQITSCGADAQCREVRRINVSAAFFVSIEFQETGYLVERMFKTAYGDASKRAQVLRAVAEHQQLRQNEFNRAFMLMEYFGYLRRNPNDAPNTDFTGWKFWLDKLNQFNGNYIEAEMVRAFISSDEYRKRFGQ